MANATDKPATTTPQSTPQPPAQLAVKPRSGQERYETARMRFVTIWSVVGAILLAGVVIYLMRILAMPISILAWTVVIVFCLREIVNRFSKWGLNRTLATVFAYVIGFIILLAIGLLLFSPIFGLNNQFNDLIKSLPGYVQQVTDWLESLYSRYSSVLNDDTVRQVISSLQSAVSSWASQVAQNSASFVINFGTAIGNSFMAIGFGLVIAFWVLMQLPAIGRETMRVIGPKHEEGARFWHWTFTRVMGGYIKGTLLQCAIIGVAGGILYAIVGVPYAAALAVITGVLNIIPIIGPWLGGGLAALMAIFVSPLSAIIVLVGIIIIQNFVYTFVSPRIMANSVDVHPAVTLLALMTGMAIGNAMAGLVGSLVGMLASIPAAAVIKAIFVYYFEKHTGRRIVAEDGVFFQGKPLDELNSDQQKAEHEGPLGRFVSHIHRTKHEEAEKPDSGADVTDDDGLAAIQDVLLDGDKPDSSDTSS